MAALNILALWGISNRLLLIVGASVFVIVAIAVIAWFALEDADEEETDEKVKKPKKEKKEKPSNEDKQRAKEEKQRVKELKKQQKLAAKEAKAQAKEGKPKKEKKPKPVKTPKEVHTKVQKEKKVKAAKPAKAKKQPKPKKKKSQACSSHTMTAGEYEYVTGLIGGCKSVLLASCSRESFPVTIAVKVAIQLAMESKCLLIDLDLRRDAIAKAFDLEDTPSTKCLRPMPYKTTFENLFIWPSHNFVRSGHMNIKYLVRAAVEKYDHVVISCPCLNKSPDRKLIAASAEAGIIFADNDKDAEYLTNLIVSRGCNILANIEIVSEDEEQVLEDFTENEADMDLGDPLGFESGEDVELAELDDLLDTEGEGAGLAELDELLDIDGEEDVQDAGGEIPALEPETDLLESESQLEVEGEMEINIGDDLSDLLDSDEGEEIDINDLFSDDDDEDNS